MQMVCLNAVVKDTKSRRAARRERGTDYGSESAVAERRNVGGGSQRHMGRTVSIVLLAAPMRNGPSSGSRLPSGATTSSAMGPYHEWEGALSHLDWADIYQELA